MRLPRLTGYLISNWKLSFAKPNLAYAYFDVAFKQLPEEMRDHKYYFEKERRGIGDRAFHVMWYVLMKEFVLRRHLEIGVYRGHILSLVAMLQRFFGVSENVTGVSPLSTAGDRASGTYIDLNYEADISKNFSHFSLSEPRLIKAHSTDETAVRAVREHCWDSIYIDGCHDHEVVKSDWLLASSTVRKGGLVVFDDAASQ